MCGQGGGYVKAPKCSCSGFGITNCSDQRGSTDIATGDLYASEEEATLVGVYGEAAKIRIEVFVKPATLKN
jgi:hypothetical protein